MTGRARLNLVILSRDNPCLIILKSAGYPVH